MGDLRPALLPWLAQLRLQLRQQAARPTHRNPSRKEMNLAHQFAQSLGLTVEEAREAYDGTCIDFAGDFLEDHLHGNGRLAYFGELCDPRWTYHAAVEVDGVIHDLWHDSPLPLDDFMTLIGAATVEYPAEVENEA